MRKNPLLENVLVVIHDASRTGAPILGWNLIKQLSGIYNIYIVCLSDGTLIPDLVAGSVSLEGPFSKRGRTPEKLERKLGSMLTGVQFKYAVINSCGSNALVRLCHQHGVRTVLLVHEFASLFSNDLPLLNSALSLADELVFSAESTAQSAQVFCPNLLNRKINIFPQGMSVMPPSEETKKMISTGFMDKLVQMRAHGDLIVLGAGSVHFRKGVDLFLSTAAHVRNQKLDRHVHFIWVGGGYRPKTDMVYSVYLHEQMVRSHLEDCVTFIDEVSDLDPIYAQADVFFMCSRLDPMPNVTIDAAHRGIPIVSFKNAGGTSDLLETSELTSRTVVDYLDTSAAASAIVALAKDETFRLELSRATRAMAENSFDMQQYVAKIDALGSNKSQSGSL